MDVGATPNDVATKTIEFLSGFPENYSEPFATSVTFDHEMPRRMADYGGHQTHVSVSVVTAVVLGWLLFAIAGALGVLVGWLIWG